MTTGDKTNAPDGTAGSWEAINHYLELLYDFSAPVQERVKVEILINCARSLERIADAMQGTDASPTS